MVGVTTAAIIILLSGGGDMEHYLTNIKKNVKSSVADKGRRTIILDESAALSKSLKTLGKEVDQHIEDLIYVHADFQSLEADFDQVTARLVADQKKAATLILDAREVMRAQTTREEWDAVFSIEKDQ